VSLAAASANAHAEDTILALDNVPLELPVAGVGSRVLAAFIDYVFVFVGMIAWMVAILTLAATVWPSGGWGIALAILGLFLIEYGYFAGIELALGGRTLGKQALGLRVVTRQGGRPGPAALLLRNVVRLVDLLVGVPLMALDPLSRRVGDRLAGTLVVHGRRRELELLVRRLPAGWGGREAAVVEGYFRRARDLEPAHAEALARRLLVLVERDDPALLQAAPPELPPAERLRRALGVEGG
jgi:uncharacterized RDD family membrane protein YckC